MLCTKCSNKAVKNGKCKRHGAFGQCVQMGCSSPAEGGRAKLCQRHATQACQVTGCKSKAVKRKRCRAHGAYNQCSTPGCMTRSSSGAYDRCDRCNPHAWHKTKRSKCALCPTPVYANGHCYKHARVYEDSLFNHDKKGRLQPRA